MAQYQPSTPSSWPIHFFAVPDIIVPLFPLNCHTLTLPLDRLGHTTKYKTKMWVILVLWEIYLFLTRYKGKVNMAQYRSSSPLSWRRQTPVANTFFAVPNIIVPLIPLNWYTLTLPLDSLGILQSIKLRCEWYLSYGKFIYSWPGIKARSTWCSIGHLLFELEETDPSGQYIFLQFQTL